MKRLQCCKAILAATLLAGVPTWAQAQANVPPAPAPPAAPAPTPAPAQPAPARPTLAPLTPTPPRQTPPTPAPPVVTSPRVDLNFAQLGRTPSAFSLVLVVGEMQGTTSNDVPEAARKALDELKAFLPFKSYRLYDSGVIGAPSENYGATLRLRGQEVRGQAAQLFEVTMARQRNSPTLDVAMREVSEILNIGSNAKKSAATSDSWANSLMSASVRLRAGETVVVGTSRIKGDTALVLLITGLPSALGTPQSEPREFRRERF